MNLNISVNSIKFDTPLILASGHITETADFFLKAKKFGCGGMVTRSLKKEIPPDRKQTPTPRYAVFDQDSMLNCEWGNEKSWEYWRDSGVQEVQKVNSPIIVSLSGREIEGCKYLIRAFDELCVNAYEINVSCPHSGALNGNLNINGEHLLEILKQIRPITKTPIWIKLSYSPFIVAMAKVAENAGADAIVCTNTIGPGLLLDIETSKPKLGIKGGRGGLSGKAIFPIALECVYEISQTVKMPVIGVGGISSSEGVIQMFMAGASAVQLYTAPALKGVAVFRDIVTGLKQFLTNHEYSSLAELVGISHQWAKENQFSSPQPNIIAESCRGCKKCYDSCNFNAIDFRQMDRRVIASINENCIACNACVGICEHKAIQASY